MSSPLHLPRIITDLAGSKRHWFEASVVVQGRVGCGAQLNFSTERQPAILTLSHSSQLDHGTLVEFDSTCGDRRIDIHGLIGSTRIFCEGGFIHAHPGYQIELAGGTAFIEGHKLNFIAGRPLPEGVTLHASKWGNEAGLIQTGDGAGLMLTAPHGTIHTGEIIGFNDGSQSRLSAKSVRAISLTNTILDADTANIQLLQGKIGILHCNRLCVDRIAPNTLLSQAGRDIAPLSCDIAVAERIENNVAIHLPLANICLNIAPGNIGDNVILRAARIDIPCGENTALLLRTMAEKISSETLALYGTPVFVDGRRVDVSHYEKRDIKPRTAQQPWFLRPGDGDFQVG